MRKLVLTILSAMLMVSITAQVPMGISHQAVIRNANNELVTNSDIGIQVSILHGAPDGTVVYSETHLITSNANGLISFVIGQGSTDDDFSAIDWANGSFFIQTEADPEGGSNYTITGTSQVFSVPYALYASTSEDSYWERNGDNIHFSIGNVGIGTATPTAKLDIRGSHTDDGVAFRIGNSDGSHRLTIFGGREFDPNPFIQWKHGDPLRFSTDYDGWTERMRITSDGKVGIGTMTPTSTLDVAGGLKANSGVISGRLGVGGSPAWIQDLIHVPGWGPDLHINTGQEEAYLWIGGSISENDSDVGHLHFIGYRNYGIPLSSNQQKISGITGKMRSRGNETNYPSGDLIFSTAEGIYSNVIPPGINYTEKMRITHHGRVGIGTDDPWEKLHVAGGGIYVDNPGGGGYDGVHVESAGGHGYQVYNAGYNGYNVYSAGDDGLNVVSAGNNGVNVFMAQNCGIDATGKKGNHLRTDLSGYYGLYVHSLWDEPGNMGLYVYGTGYFTGSLTAATLTGNGNGINNLNAGNITSGMLNNNRFNALSNLGGGTGTSFLRKDGQWIDPPNTTYSAGDDLTLIGTTFSLDNDIDVNYVRAASTAGLKLFDSDNHGFTIKNGKVGIDVAEPEYGKLCIHAGTNTAGIKLTNDLTGPNFGDGFLISWLSHSVNSAVILWNRENTPMIFATNNTQRMQIKEDGKVGIGNTNPNYPLHMGGGAYCSGTNWINASSKNLKENIRQLTLEEALEALQQLDPVKFNYIEEKDEDYLGFIAEDVPELVATKNRDGLSAMDIIALLTKVVQQQQKDIEVLKQKITD